MVSGILMMASMMWLVAFSSVNWDQVFLPSVSPFEIVVRGTVIYLSLFTLLRVVLKRQSGTVAVTDLLVVVLIADAAQNGMAGNYKSVCDSLILVSTIIAWSYLLDWLGYTFPWLGRFIYPPPLALIRKGQLQWRNMRHEFITEEELKSQMRQQGIEDLTRVKLAYMEGDGRISIIKDDGEQHSQRQRRGV